MRQRKRKRKLVRRPGKICDNVQRDDTVMIIGDFNAQIDKVDLLNSIAGVESIHNRTSNNWL